MSKSQRTKGATYEREVCHVWEQFFRDHHITLPAVLSLSRNIGQARDGGNDIDIGHYIVECKRRKSLKTLEGWLAQAERAIVDRALTRSVFKPVVVMRADNGESMVLLKLRDFMAETAQAVVAGIVP